jgi:hypothetical protein
MIMPIIIRDDDPGFFAHPALLEQLYSPLWEAGLPVCLAVIPAHDATIHIPNETGGFLDPNVPSRYRGEVRQYPITENPTLCYYLNDMARQGLVEVCLHGYSHRWREFGTDDVDYLRRAVHNGAALLRSAMPDANITTFIPPYEAISDAALEILFKAGFDVTVQAHNLPKTAQWADLQPMSVYPQPGGAHLITATPLDDLAAPDAWIACVENNPTRPVCALHHFYEFFVDYGAPIPERVAVWHRIAAHLIAHHRESITTFQKVAAAQD